MMTGGIFSRSFETIAAHDFKMISKSHDFKKSGFLKKICLAGVLRPSSLSSS